MGYCMTQVEASFAIDAQNKAAALQAIKGLAGKETIIPGKHFSWVDTEDFINVSTLEEAMSEWRWELKTNESGDVTGIEFTGEKYGDERLLFGAIAPFVKAGSYIAMRGEDGGTWRWSFDGKALAPME